MIHLNPTEKKAVAGAIQEMSDSMTRIEAERELMKEIVDTTHEKYGVEKKHFKKLATIFHKRNLDEVRGEHETVESLYEDLFEGGQ
jgi:hypothetical protein